MRRVISGILGIIVLGNCILFPLGCKNNVTNSYYRALLADEVWANNLKNLLALSYVEEPDRAAFVGFATREILPTIHTTRDILRIYQTLGKSVENPEALIAFINSMQTNQGFFTDLLVNYRVERPFPLYDTYLALDTLATLGTLPENPEMVIHYLLSLQIEDGTFNGNRLSLSTTRLGRLSNDTALIVKSFMLMGKEECIPNHIANIVREEIINNLQPDKEFPTFEDEVTFRLVGLIELLALLSPEDIPESAKDFIKYLMLNFHEMPVHLVIGVGMIENLMDIGITLRMPEIHDNEVLKSFREYIVNGIFSLQNTSGGFGPNRTIEPFTTANILVITCRLGLEYPNLNVLLKNIETHRLDNGWAKFVDCMVDASSCNFTYWAIQIGNLIGFTDYNPEKVRQYFEEVLSDNTATLHDIYYAVKGLKLLNQKLTTKQQLLGQANIVRLAGTLNPTNTASMQFAYAVLLSQELGFQYSQAINRTINELSFSFKNDLISAIKSGEYDITSLYLLWTIQKKENPLITEQEVRECLDIMYSSSTGGYTRQWLFGIKYRPDVINTYYASLLLNETNTPVPDKHQTISFVLACKDKYGFDYSTPEFMKVEWDIPEEYSIYGIDPSIIPYFSTSSQPDFASTYAALMTLKLLSE